MINKIYYFPASWEKQMGDLTIGKWAKRRVRSYCMNRKLCRYNALRHITWDSIATRPLSIQKDGTWYYAPARPAAQGTLSQVSLRLGVWLHKSFTFTLVHAARDNDFNIIIFDPTDTVTNYIMNAVNDEIEEAVPNIVSKLSSTIGSSLKSVVSAFNALNSIKRRAILATSIGTLYNKATLEIVASRCCCRKRNNETVYIKRTIKGNGHNDGIMIDLRGLLMSSVTNKKLFNDLVSEMGNALGNVFFEAIVDLNGKTCS